MNKEAKIKKTTNKTTKTKVKRKRVVLEFAAQPGSEVFVAGSFNSWDADQKRLKENAPGRYKITMMLPVGEYEYKFVSNGLWQADPKADQWAANPFGSLNSVLSVVA